ncbi:hypothetical protein PVBG_06166 [Plasmodium vivax Brazil I]|uniref:Uncharacterized protein n=1 Tax=Plasmodium vivax (strain Brazil I) TaxID=1033975 RepID=A0A0J9SM29_PLAV1|nr:hypothetical protein PVBG_06166 [Plasmodium vivax Brazil I]
MKKHIVLYFILYNFLDNVDEYVQASEKINSVNLEPKDNNDCANFSNQHAKSFTEIGKNICEQFLKLYKSLPNLKNNISNGSCSKKNCGFLNYWLNFELKKHNQNTCVNVFHNGIESQCNNTIDNILPNNVIYNIDEDHLYKIDKLYNLYSNYTKLKAIIGSSLEKDKQERLQLSTKCCADYNEVSYICKDDNKNNEDNIEFCEKLDIFKNNYEKLYTQLGEEGSEISNSFKKLTECGNTRIIATAILGSVAGIIPLMGGLYKVKN